MWNRLKKLFSNKSTETATEQSGRPPCAPPLEPAVPAEPTPPVLAFDNARPEVEAFLKLDISSAKADSEKGEQAKSVMKKMAIDIDQIERAARGNPENAIDTGLWLSGSGYGNLAQELTDRFRESGWLDHEQFASALWARSTLAVNATFHHLVGPAMLANADCQQRLGNTDRATYIYTSVFKDFVFLIATWQQNPAAPDGDDKAAIECLRTAIEKLTALGNSEVEGTDLKTTGEHVLQILERSGSGE